MEVVLKRLRCYDKYTLGILTIDNVFQCFTLEDVKRDVKVYGETRIPAGRFKLRLQLAGRLHDKYKKLYPFHKGMINICNVPNFAGVMIHVGNTDRDTAGCILLGNSHDIGSDFIGNSTKAYTNAYLLISNDIIRGNDVYLNVVDEVV